MNLLETIIAFITRKEVYGIVFTIIGSLIIYKTAIKLTNKIALNGKNNYEIKRGKTVVNLVQNVIKYFIIIIALLIILEFLGVDTKSLIAGLGVIGVVLGLALQDTLKDIISGITIIMENYFVVGDIVRYPSFNNFTGEVIAFGLKSTRIKNLNGEVLILANRNIIEIVNISQKAAEVIIDIPIAYEEKVETVEKVIEEIINNISELEGVHKNKAEYLGVQTLDSSSVNYRIKIVCNQELQWDIKRKTLRNIKMTLDKKKIKIPYPQLEVHNGKTNKNK